jgi:hypothetical protein
MSGATVTMDSMFAFAMARLPRIRHAVVRDFITCGGGNDKGKRPRIMFARGRSVR